jgi:hypothetical protein
VTNDEHGVNIKILVVEELGGDVVSRQCIRSSRERERWKDGERLIVVCYFSCYILICRIRIASEHYY